MTKNILTGLGIIFASLSTPCFAQSSNITSSGGMTFLAQEFKQSCIEGNIAGNSRAMSYNDIRHETRYSNVNGWNVMLNNIKFNVFKTPETCSVSVGTPSGLTNISPLIRLLNEYSTQNRYKFIPLPVNSEIVEGLDNRYQSYALYAEKNPSEIVETWYVRYTLYKGEKVPASFIFDETNTGWNSIKVTLTKIRN